MLKETNFKSLCFVTTTIFTFYYDSGWTLDTNADDYTYYTLTNTSIDLSTTYTLLPCQWLFLIPQSQSTIHVEIKYTVDGGAEQSKLIDLGTDSWTAGNSYTINIRVGTSFL